jgi:hypothetical protein
MALLARFWPARKLMVEVLGRGTPTGAKVRLPLAAGPTVTLAAMAWAAVEMPHWPATEKDREPAAARSGPPSGPGVFRVSKIRQGGTV